MGGLSPGGGRWGPPRGGLPGGAGRGGVRRLGGRSLGGREGDWGGLKRWGALLLLLGVCGGLGAVVVVRRGSDPPWRAAAEVGTGRGGLLGRLSQMQERTRLAADLLPSNSPPTPPEGPPAGMRGGEDGAEYVHQEPGEAAQPSTPPAGVPARAPPSPPAGPQPAGPRPTGPARGLPRPWASPARPHAVPQVRDGAASPGASEEGLNPDEERGGAKRGSEELLRVGAAVQAVREKVEAEHAESMAKLGADGKLSSKSRMDHIQRMSGFLQESDKCLSGGPSSAEASSLTTQMLQTIQNVTMNADGGGIPEKYPTPKSFICSEPICYNANDVEHISILRTKRLFIAFNLKNNADLMPHFISELLRLVEHLDRDKVFVSVYESGSHDMTPQWMEVLSRVLVALEVPHRVVFGDLSDRLTKSSQNRIKFLANVRNRALEPLPVVQPDGSLGPVNPDAPVIARDADGSPSVFDQVVFLNDVYFCLGDIARLSANGADMACGLDFLTKDTKFEVCSANFGQYGYPNFGEDFQRARFYDFWVARTLNGQKFENCAPYVRDSPKEVLAMAAGHPFQVSCCWNGLAVINAEPLHRGLRFRSEAVTPNMQRYYVTKASSENPFEKGDACAASECSIMCQDLWGLGYEKIVVDPSVKVTYASSGFRLRENFWPRVTSTIKNYREYWRLAGGGREREADAPSDLFPPIDWQPLGPQHECCPMKVQSGLVGWETPGACYFEDTSAPHFFETTPKLPPLPTM